MKKGVVCLLLMVLLMGSSYAKEKSIIDTIAERIEFHGELEAGFKVEAVGHKSENNKVHSEIQLTTAGLSIEASVTDWINVTVVPLFEVDEFFIDEGYMTIGPTENIPFYLTGGLLYHPFGKREEYTHFPDDPFVNFPLTLYFGEIWDPGLIVGYTQKLPVGSLTLEGFLVYSDVSKCDDKRHADTFGFNVSYNLSNEDYNFEIGGSYISNVLDASGLKDYFEDLGAWDGDLVSERDVDGIAVYMSGEYKNFYFTAEYMTVTEPFKGFYERGGTPEELTDTKGESLHPHVWGFEIGANIEEMLGLPKPVEVMFRYEGSLEAQPIYDIPKNRWAIGVNVGLYEYLTWSVAYAVEDYDPDWETDYEDDRTSRNLFFTQMAVEF
ncbi:MAG TPA: LbtU family siderophore porin [Candidatus Desulfofervidus auxilii]|uniref:LbtU family siderophore porin n=1 Tax=Desulfofervidus auxilii TaxID=1621989 RepID=A0A7C0U3N2_DESA2|nr:LbtU family siderophore porin [Candidatus Desulfofervidus auxilii]